ncbi:MAG TPA: DUF5985 family protein [Tepidisphaeraceae bacterium]|jgi:drug/metabolite transporter (DMT)-like permease|nr:DUF5985 family protein [Tepidisphaeraceae bacterium]
MAQTVYILCALTCVACAILLFRGYCRTRARMLLWSSLCFAGLIANNILLFLDKVTLPNTDLSLARTVVALLSLIVMLYGLIFDSE